MDQAQRGATALDGKRYNDAVTHYTAAIALNPEAVDYYIKRSAAYNRTSSPDYDAALRDAEQAVALAHARGKRELLSQAQLRRAIAFFGLEQWHAAQQCFAWVRKLDEKEKSLPIWDAKLKTKTFQPSVDIAEIPLLESIQSLPAPKAPSVSQTPLHKIRHEWFQHNEAVVVTVFAKGLPKQQTTVEIQPQSVEVDALLTDGASYQLCLDPLREEIDPSKSSFSITSTKIEIVLHKKVPGHVWSTLEGEIPPTTTNAPVYPTSSRTGPKNWDKLSTDLTGKKAEDLEEEGDAVNGFFKKLYAGADPDTRRAMMKSYQESNGTALSTNWAEVGKGKVDTQAPEGMEAKPW